MTLEEAMSLRPGDPVEWNHPKGGWRLATFVSIYAERQSMQIKTDVGCDVFRRIEKVRKVDRK